MLFFNIVWGLMLLQIVYVVLKCDHKKMQLILATLTMKWLAYILHCRPTDETGDVLNDIDNMLQDLTNELDAMLELEMAWRGQH
jgi:hypothetical protein